jgi:hypothetical protein
MGIHNPVTMSVMDARISGAGPEAHRARAGWIASQRILHKLKLISIVPGRLQATAGAFQRDIEAICLIMLSNMPACITLHTYSTKPKSYQRC